MINITGKTIILEENRTRDKNVEYNTSDRVVTVVVVVT